MAVDFPRSRPWISFPHRRKEMGFVYFSTFVYTWINFQFNFLKARNFYWSAIQQVLGSFILQQKICKFLICASPQIPSLHTFYSMINLQIANPQISQERLSADHKSANFSPQNRENKTLLLKKFHPFSAPFHGKTTSQFLTAGLSYANFFVKYKFELEHFKLIFCSIFYI